MRAAFASVFVAMLLAACAPTPDTTTRQGRFVNLIRVLADSGRIGEPEEVGRLLGIDLAEKAGGTHSLGASTCGRKGGEQWQSWVTKSYFPAGRFWFTDELHAAGGLAQSFTYRTSSSVDCEGRTISGGLLVFGELDKVLCVQPTDAAALAGEENLPPFGRYYVKKSYDGWRSERVGTRAFLSWPDSRGSQQPSCMLEALVRQGRELGYRADREREARPRNLIGPGTGAAIGAIPSTVPALGTPAR